MAVSAILYVDQRTVCGRSRRQHLAAVHSGGAARVFTAVRSLGLAGVVRRAGADPPAAGHEHGSATAGNYSPLPVAAGRDYAAERGRLPAHPPPRIAVC